jgi:hypothetical protein
VPQNAPVGDSIAVQVLSPSANVTSNIVTIAIEQAN